MGKMNYGDTLDWMFAQLPMYQQKGASAYKIDLSNTLLLVSNLGNPEKKFKSIHVAGTNGKGSTSHMLASILQEAGYKVGLYTSPHLKDFRERIRINGKKISEQYVIDFINDHKAFFEYNQLSFFEMTVGLAFQFFADSQVDIAVVEVGLGGRLDSTNIVIPEVSVITNIGMDHTQFLGDTIAQIASEKAGIIKKNVSVVVGRTTPVTETIFRKRASLLQSDLFFAEDYNGELFDTDLQGHYQEENKKTAVQTISVLHQQGWDIKQEDIKRGLKNVVKNTALLGRWHVLQESPKVICDTAHNEDGLEAVMKQLLEEKYDNLHIVIGVVKDKDLEEILALFPIEATYYFAKPNISRGLSEKKLQKEAARFSLFGGHYSSVKKAYKKALHGATRQDVIYVGGSTFVVAEII